MAGNGRVRGSRGAALGLTAGDVRHDETVDEGPGRDERGTGAALHGEFHERRGGADGDAAGGYAQDVGDGKRRSERRRDVGDASEAPGAVGPHWAVPRVLARDGAARAGHGDTDANRGTVQEGARPRLLLSLAPTLAPTLTLLAYLSNEACSRPRTSRVLPA